MLLPELLLLVTGMHLGKWFVGWQWYWGRWVESAGIFGSGVRGDDGVGKSGLGSGVRGYNDGVGKSGLGSGMRGYNDGAGKSGD